MKLKYTMIPAFALTAFLVGCEQQEHTTVSDAAEPAEEAHDQPHDEESRDDHDHGQEESLGSFQAGDLEIEAAQAHGAIEAGKEGHLVIKLPYSDDGATVVRSWIGTEDRTMSSVGKGEYAPSHDDYDIHTMAPDPLPADAKWWVEVEKPGGTTVVGSIAPKM